MMRSAVTNVSSRLRIVRHHVFSCPHRAPLDVVALARFDFRGRGSLHQRGTSYPRFPRLSVSGGRGVVEPASGNGLRLTLDTVQHLRAAQPCHNHMMATQPRTTPFVIERIGAVVGPQGLLTEPRDVEPFTADWRGIYR